MLRRIEKRELRIKIKLREIVIENRKLWRKSNIVNLRFEKDKCKFERRNIRKSKKSNIKNRKHKTELRKVAVRINRE